MTKIKKNYAEKEVKSKVLRDKVRKTKNKIAPSTRKSEKKLVNITKTPLGTNRQSSAKEPQSTPKDKKLREIILKTPLGGKNADQPSVISTKTPKVKKLQVRISKTPLESLTNPQPQRDAMSCAPNTPKTKRLLVNIRRTPLSSKILDLQPSENPVASIPNLSKRISKCTSTPLDRPARKMALNSKYKDFITTLKTPTNFHLSDISNIVGSKTQDSDIANKRIRKEIKDSIQKLPAAKRAKVNKENYQNDANKVKTKINGGMLNSSRIILRDVISNSSEISHISNAKLGGKRSIEITRSNLSQDKTLLKQLKGDWTGTSFEESKTREQNNNSSLLSLRKTKRPLAPVLENSSIVDEECSAVCNTLANDDESGDEAYSSSEEFEVANEKENSILKRAPTWEKLSNKAVLSCLSDVSSQSLDVRQQTSVPPKETQSELSVKATCESGTTLTKNQEKSNSPKTQDLSVSKSPATTASLSLNTRSLLNKSDLIEQVLSSSADDVADTTSNTCRLNDPHKTNCSRKFFVSRLENTTRIPVKKAKKSKQGRRTRAKKEKQEQVYEFLSQSSSGSNDPAADVIKEMIKTGKVVVAKHRKGKGKLALPRKKYKTRKKKTAEQEALYKPNGAHKPEPVTSESNRITPPIEEHDNESVFNDEPARDHRGFSELARSAMINEAGKNSKTYRRTMMTDKRKLLEMAQKFVGQSTPMRISSPHHHIPTLSPIPGSASPWRADDDKLPSTFYFSRNNDNLPSFSSDYIPSTPSKRKSKSATSSYSSNDSNMENIAPPTRDDFPSTVNQSNQQNARRALLSSHRSPLKAINVLDVVNLPPLALNNFGIIADDKENSQPNKTMESAGNIENPKDISEFDKTSNMNSDVEHAADNTGLFGFEEFLNDDDEAGLSDVSIDPTTISNKDELKDRLRRLKRLRPEVPVIESSKNTRIKPVFDEHRTRQKTLKQMLCSTMIETPSQHKEPQKSNNREKHDRHFNDGYDQDLSNLFKDPEPETTFNELQPRRTYSRPFKRKRKLRHNFVMFMDSDVSEDEDHDENENHGKKKKKRTKNNAKEEAELNKFVNEFNEMCKEVTQYELIVE